MRLALAALVVATSVISTHRATQSNRRGLLSTRRTVQRHPQARSGEHVRFWSREDADVDVQLEEVQRYRGPAVQNRICFPYGGDV